MNEPWHRTDPTAYLVHRFSAIFGRLLRRGGAPTERDVMALLLFQDTDPLRGDGVPGRWKRYRASYLAEHGTWALPLP